MKLRKIRRAAVPVQFSGLTKIEKINRAFIVGEGGGNYCAECPEHGIQFGPVFKLCVCAREKIGRGPSVSVSIYKGRATGQTALTITSAAEFRELFGYSPPCGWWKLEPK